MGVTEGAGHGHVIATKCLRWSPVGQKVQKEVVLRSLSSAVPGDTALAKDDVANLGTFTYEPYISRVHSGSPPVVLAFVLVRDPTSCWCLHDKPVLVGYNVLLLYKRGYYYCFCFTSPIVRLTNAIKLVPSSAPKADISRLLSKLAK
jgi:hypothetical protein